MVERLVGTFNKGKKTLLETNGHISQKIGRNIRNPKRKGSFEPTIHVQGQAASFREGKGYIWSKTQEATFGPGSKHLNLTKSEMALCHGLYFIWPAQFLWHVFRSCILVNFGFGTFQGYLWIPKLIKVNGGTHKFCSGNEFASWKKNIEVTYIVDT